MLPVGLVERIRNCVRPILMVTLVSLTGLIPMALTFGQGAGMWRVMAWTVIAGLISSTALVLLLIPSSYVIYQKLKLLKQKSR